MRSPPSNQGTLPLAPPQAVPSPALSAFRRRRIAPWVPFPIFPEDMPLARARRLASDAAYVLLAATGFSVMSLLAVLGCVVLLFLVISHGRFDMFVAQVNNLTTRYAAADAVRQESFRRLVLEVTAGLALLIFALRLPRFIRSLKRELIHKDRP